MFNLQTAPLVTSSTQKNRETISHNSPDDSTRLLDTPSSHAHYGSGEVASERGSVDQPDPASSHSPKLVLSPLILCICGVRSFTDMCVTVLRPLVWSTSVTLGGLGFDTYHIGLIMGIWGIVNATFQITCLGSIIRRIGPKNMLLVAFGGYVVAFSLYPILTSFVRSAGRVDFKVMLVLMLQLTLAILNNGAYGMLFATHSFEEPME
jgi:hypothetical protein